MRGRFAENGILLCSLLVLGVACSGTSSRNELARQQSALGMGSGPMHGQLLQKKATVSPISAIANTSSKTSAPFGAHSHYFGGRVVSNAQVVQVIYGTGSYLPGSRTPGRRAWRPSIRGCLNSPYVDWLREYNTARPARRPTANQIIGRGSFASQVTIIPSPQNNGTVIDDCNIQAELAAQIQAGNIPAPTHDALGNNNTYYAIFFPHGKIITVQGVELVLVLLRLPRHDRQRPGRRRDLLRRPSGLSGRLGLRVRLRRRDDRLRQLHAGRVARAGRDHHRRRGRARRPCLGRRSPGTTRISTGRSATSATTRTRRSSAATASPTTSRPSSRTLRTTASPRCPASRR